MSYFGFMGTPLLLKRLLQCLIPVALFNLVVPLLGEVFGVIGEGKIHSNR